MSGTEESVKWDNQLGIFLINSYYGKKKTFCLFKKGIFYFRRKHWQSSDHSQKSIDPSQN